MPSAFISEAVLTGLVTDVQSHEVWNIWMEWEEEKLTALAVRPNFMSLIV